MGMPGYGQMQWAPAEQKSADARAADHKPAARVHAGGGGALGAALNENPRAQSLMQLRAALDESPRVRAQLALQRVLNDTAPVEKKPNATGLPDRLKDGVENLSGLAMDDVRVHYNSSKPAAVQAHAYAQGTDIHVAPGQETHLPHEAWHVVQQKQGRVKPTLQLKGVAINDDTALEREADAMGFWAAQIGLVPSPKADDSTFNQSAARPGVNAWHLIQRAVVKVTDSGKPIFYDTGDPNKTPFPTREAAKEYSDANKAAWAKQRAMRLGAGGSETMDDAPARQADDVKQEVKTDTPAQQGIAHDPWSFGKSRGGSDIVPDLPSELVKKIQAAETDDARQEVLEELYQLLQARGIVHAEIIKAGLAMKYLPAKTGEFGEYFSYRDKPPELQIGPQAFASAPLLYSTVRHELIHGEQFRLEGREEVKADDEPAFVYQDLTRTPSKAAKAFLKHASEVETHAWEILAATWTGTVAENVEEPTSGEAYVRNRKQILNNKMIGCNQCIKPLRTQKYQVLYKKALERFKEASQYFRTLYPNDPLSKNDGVIEKAVTG
jgi:hypothetical protein